MLYKQLQGKGVQCYYAPRDLRGGKKLHSQITQEIHVNDTFLLILSENSIKSNWVATEIKSAKKRERELNKQMLFPIRLISYEALKTWELFDSDTGTDLAEEVRSYFIPDFSNWKNPDSYKKALDNLLRDLKAESNK